jgi:hypothetical protein
MAIVRDRVGQGRGNGVLTGTAGVDERATSTRSISVWRRGAYVTGICPDEILFKQITNLMNQK